LDWQAQRYRSPEAYYQAVYQAFRQAQLSAGQAPADGAGDLNHTFRIGGQVVRLNFASQALVPRITPALEHLRVEPGEDAQLEVCLWDSASTRTPFPPHPWSGEGAVAIAQDFDPGEGRIYFHDDRLRMYFYLEEMALFLDENSRRAIFWVPDAAGLPIHETAAPLRSLLHWWFGDESTQFVHAAGVGTPQGGVLLVGRGGSGKSTSTLACLGSGLQIAGDDYCLVTNRGNPVVHSLYCSAKIEPGFLSRLPSYSMTAGRTFDDGGDKSVVYLCNLNHAQIILQFPLLALFIPRITGGQDTSLRPAPAMHGLKALAPSTIFQLVEPGEKAFRALARLARQVPSYYLDLGTDLRQIPGVIMDYLHSRGGVGG
jgi:hypothetical protein